MRPKVKISKPSAPKKEPINSGKKATQPPQPQADASAAKKRKQKKLLKAKLKQATKLMAPADAVAAGVAVESGPPITDQALLLRGKPKQKASGKRQLKSEPLDKMEKVDPLTSQQQQSKKRKQAPSNGAEDKRPRIEANGAAAPSEPKPERQHGSGGGGRPGYLADTEPVRDPVLRAELADWLRQRAASTVRIGRLPNRLRPAQICQLCHDVQAARVPWNYATGRNRGMAFLEFASPEAARRALAELANSKALGTKVEPSIRDDLKDEDLKIDTYNCRRVVVSSLHPLTTGQELKDLVGGVQRVDFLHGSKALRKHAPAVAFLTFADERRALEAAKKFQGHVIRNRGTSWLLQKRSDRPEHTRHRTQLVAFGVSKRVTDEDMLRAFPGSQSIDVRGAHGMAIITYANEVECQVDFDACKGGLARVGKAKLRVQFGHALHRPREQRKQQAASQLQQQSLPAPPPRVQKRPPPPASKIDPSLFNKCQLIVKNFKPSTQEGDLTGFLPGARRVFFTGNRRLAFVHFAHESAAAAALEKLGAEPLNGAKLNAMYAMDKPDKKKTGQDVSMTSGEGDGDNEPLSKQQQRPGKKGKQQQQEKSQVAPGVILAGKKRFGGSKKFSARASGDAEMLTRPQN